MIEIKKLEIFPEVKVEHSKEYIQKISELRKKTKRRESSIISFSQRRKIAILVATVIILALAFTACAFGKEIKDLFFEIYESFTRTEVEGEPNTTEFVQYIPSYIPDDYMLTDNEVNNSSSRTIWYNGSNYIYLDQDKQSSNKLILDTEDSPYTITFIGDTKIYYILENNTYIFIWLYNDYQFSLICHHSLDWINIENMVSSIAY